MRPISLLVPLLLCCAAPLPAQGFAHWLDAGTRVRVTSPSLQPRRVTGEVAAALPDTLVLSPGGRGRIAIANRRIELIEVSRGRDRRRGAWRGALLGTLVGVGIGGISGALASPELPTGVPASAAIGAAAGGLLGAGAGAGLGAALAPEGWQRYTVGPPPPPR